MKLRRLTIQRLPGITEPFTLEVGEEDFQVITGPNGSGKSSLCRAARALLWQGLGPRTGITASAVFEEDGVTWTAERDGSRWEWQQNGLPSAPPRLPASHLEACFFLALRALLDEEGSAGPDVARAIRRQMAGNFDLDEAAQQAFGPPKPNLGRPESRKLSAAEKDLQHALRQQAALAEQEARLEEMLRQRDQAAEAGRRLQAIQDAQHLVEARRQREAWQVQVDALAEPTVLAAMTGREEEELEEKDRQVTRLRERLGSVRGEREEAERLRRESGLAGDVPADRLAACRRRADELATLEHGLQGDRVQLAEAERVLQSTALPLGDRARPGQEARLVDRSALFRYLGQAEGLRLQEAALRQRVQLLRRVDPPAPDPTMTERLREAVVSLREWLRAAAPGTPGTTSPSTPTWALVLLVAGALMAAAGLADLVPSTWFLLAAGVVAGTGLGGLLAASRRGPALSSPGEPRTAATQRFARLDLEAPAEWNVPSVDRRLQELEAQLTEALAQEVRRRDRGVEAKELEDQLAALSDQRRELDGQYTALFQAIDVDPQSLDLARVDLLSSLSDWRQRRDARDALQARVEERSRRCRQEREDLAAFLTGYGIAAPANATEARAGLDEVTRRVQQRQRADEQERKARRDQETLEAELETGERARTALFQRCALEDGDRAGLTRRLDDHRRYLELREEERELNAAIRQYETRLQQAGEAALTEQTAETLETLAATASAQAASKQEWDERCATIQEQVRLAREGHALEDRLAEVESCREALARCRDEALAARAGRFLLERVRARHEQTQAPRVLQRARGLFARFTNNQYQLQVAGHGDGGLRAVETRTGKGLGPAELSDGTRAQLMLAARVAFAEEADQGGGLPLFLDEAMDQSDPERARAITRALGRLAAETGRQVFYLTSDPKDVNRIQLALAAEGVPAARVHDLAEVRGRGHRVEAEEDLHVPPLAEPPEVSGHSPESYAVALGAPHLEPARGARDQHLIHVAWDDLPLLRRMLQSRVTRVGPWQELADQNPKLAALIAGDSAVARQLDARARLLQRFCELWQEGRGRPVDRTTLEESGAVSDVFLDRLCEFLADCRGDAARLIAALRHKEDERLAGFRSNKAEDLERFLEGGGHLDPRPVLDQEGLQQRILATPVAAELPPATVASCVQRWWRLARDPEDQGRAASPSA